MNDATHGRRPAITPEDFAAAEPAVVAPQLDAGTIHLWRLPYRRAQGRGPLRALLAGYLGVDSAAIALHDDEHGKPHLGLREPAANRAAQEKTASLRFNWSHSGDVALLALASGAEMIGVDIERVRPRARALDLARRFFAPAEADALAACTLAERERAFLALWCAKEATLKALGRGIAFGLQRVAFARGGDGWVPGQFDAGAGAAHAWQLHALVPMPGYLGALAWRGPRLRVQAWRPAAEA